MQRESLNETREQSREDKGEDGERKMRPPPLRAKEKRGHAVRHGSQMHLMPMCIGLFTLKVDWSLW